ncbi:tRNA (adenosine(37)-N6)-threonylcarbamoyltransferase complex dimerization subunit type 1 TsaB [Weissella confusa]|uniref:tRNA (adenosine(37)-N6)-threonylcarbamoyltransferase complex dimerization subunit type 1 TsaB n=1 Tax=Weissella confusa TaxID=1583 RepID=UPI0022FF2194|nr:tRNA (adenosine(37)-N6)-threonylcarbamoyltransferase complex dimerization subunit type 1 TsaB [Weissella confusa]MDA5458026.1 metal-dependent protease, putative molecular chaperone [Weissella confusa]
MKVIAFDTSNQPLSVALFEDDKLIGQRETNVAKNHSVQLLPFIDELVKSAGWAPADLDRVVVSQGPGSYTGLRIAVTTAKTLAFTLGIELVGISSLGLLATNVTTPGVTIVPVMDARNANLYAGQYELRDGKYVATVADRHTNVPALISQLAEENQQVVFVGEWARFEEELRQALPDAQFASDNLPHAANVLPLVTDAQVLTDMTDIHQFVPNYYRLSQAEADWAKAHPDAGDGVYVEKV